MSNIENFAALSEPELKTFAEELVKVVNDKGVFTDWANFTVTEVEADDLTGSLLIYISHGADLLDVTRPATWHASDDEDAYSVPEDAEFENSIYNDAVTAFKTMSTEINGYKVSLAICDVDEEQTTEVIVDTMTDADDGIGWYEYWGDVQYDSIPYVEVEGSLVKACHMALALEVDLI